MFSIFATLKPEFRYHWDCHQEWNNLVARGMVAEIKPRLATNNILLPFWCHCLP